MKKIEGKKKKRGRPNYPLKHGAYSLIARGDLPENRRYLREYLTICREGLISDLGPKEEDLSTAQRILIDRVIGKLGVLRCLEEYAREQGVIKKGKLSSPLEHNFLAWSNSLRLDLQALGIDKRAEAKILNLAEYIQAKDAERDEKSKATDTEAQTVIVPTSPSEEISGMDDAPEPEKSDQADEDQDKAEDEPTDAELPAAVAELEKRLAVLQDGQGKGKRD